jgi:hypothetical protein
VNGTATFSRDGRYRFELTRRVEGGNREETMLFVMLNPSTADATNDDATIRRCVGFARREGLGLLKVVNLYALKATRPVHLWDVEDPIGPANDRYIAEAAKTASVVVAAWGVPPGPARGRAVQVAGMLDRYGPLALGTTKGGHPRHPLYVRADAKLRLWSYL